MNSSGTLVAPRKSTMRRLAVALLAILTVLLGAPPADAATWTYTRATLGNPGDCYGPFATPPYGVSYYGMGCFRDTGDYIKVTDSVRDSYLVAVHWRVPGIGREGLCVNPHGGGTNAYCNYDFPENYFVQFRVGRCYNWRDCGSLANYVNWGDWQATNNDNYLN